MKEMEEGDLTCPNVGIVLPTAQGGPVTIRPASQFAHDVGSGSRFSTFWAAAHRRGESRDLGVLGAGGPDLGDRGVVPAQAGTWYFMGPRCP